MTFAEVHVTPFHMNLPIFCYRPSMVYATIISMTVFSIALFLVGWSKLLVVCAQRPTDCTAPILPFWVQLVCYTTRASGQSCFQSVYCLVFETETMWYLSHSKMANAWLFSKCRLFHLLPLFQPLETSQALVIANSCAVSQSPGRSCFLVATTRYHYPSDLSQFHSPRL